MDLGDIRRQLDDERQHLVRTGEIISLGPLVTRLQNNSRYSIAYSSLTAENADETIAREIGHHRKLGIPFEWKLYSHDMPSDLLERLQRHGLIAGPCEAVMVFDLADGSIAPPNEKLSRTIVRIDQLSQLADFRRVAEEVFEKNYDFTVTQLAAAIAAGSTEHQGYLAYCGGEPVSIGRLYTHPQSLFAGLYGGGTRKNVRGQGFYREIVAARARDAAILGSRYLLVDALPTSRPILEWLGFEKLTDTWPCEWIPLAFESPASCT